MRTVSPIFAASSAAHSAASSACGPASVRLLLIVSSNRCVAWLSHPIRLRTSAAGSVDRSGPPSSTRPASGGTTFSASAASVDLPAPDGPSSATCAPAGISSVAGGPGCG